MTDGQKLDLATRFEIGDHARFETVKVEMTDNGHGPYSGDGVKRWAIRHGGDCLNVVTLEWEWEPQPSSRTREWMDQHRVRDLDQALEIATLAEAQLARERAEIRASRS